MIISVPATSANLGPGFDSLGLALDLRNTVDIRPSRFHSVSVRGEGENNPKLKGNNLFVGIFNDHYNKLTQKRQNFKFTFHNQVPLSRGLGSSSAVIVSAISSAHEAAGVRVSKRRILNHALQYEPHPDNIAPTVYGGFVSSVVENKNVFSLKKDIPEYLRAIIVIPDTPMSTSKSRTQLSKNISMECAVYNISRASLLCSAFFSENWDMLKIASQDCIHQDKRMLAMPELKKVQEIALDNGALMSTLSGSGSSFFTLCFETDALKIQSQISKIFVDFRVEIFTFDNKGYTIDN